MAVLRMAERELPVHLVLVAASEAGLGQVAGLLELADDVPDRSLGDADGGGDVSQAPARVVRDASEHMGVVGNEPPTVIVRLYDSVLNDHRFIVSGGGDTSVALGALAEIITAIAGIGTAVTLFPVLRRQSESLALGYVALRVVESALITVGICSVLAVVTLRQDLAGGATDSASLMLNGRSLVAVDDATSCSAPRSAPPSATA